MKKICILSIILLVLLMCWCWKNRENLKEWQNLEEWQRMGFYYPDRNDIWNSSLRVIKWWFDSLQECRDWAIWKWNYNNDNYDYECWFKCRQSGWLYVCEKTLD